MINFAKIFIYKYLHINVYKYLSFFFGICKFSKDAKEKITKKKRRNDKKQKYVSNF